MPVEHLTPDVVPSAGPPHVSVARGSTMYFFSGQVGRRADGTPAGDFADEGGEVPPLTASTLVGVASLCEPWCLVEMDAIAVAD